MATFGQGPRPDILTGAGATRWSNAHILEWRDYSGCHDDWFVADGFHLRTPGQQAYAAFIRDGILGKAPTTCTK